MGLQNEGHRGRGSPKLLWQLQLLLVEKESAVYQETVTGVITTGITH